MKLHLIERIKKFIKKSAHSKGKASQDMGDPKNQASRHFIASKNESMKSSQGNSDFSGSSYNGPGNVDAEKRNSNMSQRNF